MKVDVAELTRLVRAKLSGELDGYRLVTAVGVSAMLSASSSLYGRHAFSDLRKEVANAATTEGREGRKKFKKGGGLAAEDGTTDDGQPTAGSDADKKGQEDASADNKKQPKVAVDGIFLKRFIRLMKIAFPSIHSMEGIYLAVLSVLLLLRTAMTLKIASVTSFLAKCIVDSDGRAVFMNVLRLAGWAVPAAMINSALKYFTDSLKLSFRVNLAREMHSRYLRGDVFFKCVGFGGISHIDQRITKDIKLFAEDAAEIYTTLFKPIIDIVLFTRQIAQHGGYKGPMMIVGYYSAITLLLRLVMPNFALLTAMHQRREGDLRSAHTKLINAAEEVSLYGGQATERGILNRLFDKVVRHQSYVAYHRANTQIIDSMLVKYGSVMLGYWVCALTVFSKEAANLSSGELTQLFQHTSALLSNLARAIGQLIVTYKKVTSLAGYTFRVAQLQEGLEAIANGEETNFFKGEYLQRGEVVIRKDIRFDSVPLLSPDGSVLVESLSFYVKPGMNLLIVGPNGCGKSSTFRLLGELWPLRGGRIEKPQHDDLYYVPQRPYMAVGTLRDQIIYPHTRKQMKPGGEARLSRCLEKAALESMLDRDNVNGDFNAVLDWASVAGGEKQKMAMARLFYHEPKFAILDECSSAIDLEVEQRMYQMCGESGITVLTIAHRRSVWKYHNWVLRFDGEGGYMFSPVRFDENNMILSDVKFASDPSVIGKEIRP